jgi:ubiquinone/menaquinone biosynthesis C-methylase UbiE
MVGRAGRTTQKATGAGYYDGIARGYDELHREEQLRKLAVILGSIAIRKDDLLLDVGCGTAFSQELLHCNYVGLDISRSMLEGRKNVVLGDAGMLPFRSGMFDVVISVTAIHNFQHPGKALREIKRVGRRTFAFSVLQKSRGFGRIEKLIRGMFLIRKRINEGRDIIFVCAPRGRMKSAKSS